MLSKTLEIILKLFQCFISDVTSCGGYVLHKCVTQGSANFDLQLSE